MYRKEHVRCLNKLGAELQTSSWDYQWNNENMQITLHSLAMWKETMNMNWKVECYQRHGMRSWGRTLKAGVLTDELYITAAWWAVIKWQKLTHVNMELPFQAIQCWWYNLTWQRHLWGNFWLIFHCPGGRILCWGHTKRQTGGGSFLATA